MKYTTIETTAIGLFAPILWKDTSPDASIHFMGHNHFTSWTLPGEGLAPNKFVDNDYINVPHFEITEVAVDNTEKESQEVLLRMATL